MSGAVDPGAGAAAAGAGPARGDASGGADAAPGTRAAAATIRLEWSLALEAPRPRVFAALTEARHLERWFCDEATCEPGVGGAIELRWRRPGASEEPFRGRWEAWSPPERVAYRGGHPGYPDGDSGRVEYTLGEVEGATRLDVMHELPARGDYEPIAARYRDVWPRTLARLVSYLTPEGA